MHAACRVAFARFPGTNAPVVTKLTNGASTFVTDGDESDRVIEIETSSLLVRALRRKEQVLEEESRELGPSAEVRFSVHGERLLSCGPLGGAARVRDLLHAQTFEQQDGDVALGVGQRPSVALTLDRSAETLERALRFLAPLFRRPVGRAEAHPQIIHLVLEGTPRAHPPQPDVRGRRYREDGRRDLEHQVT